MALLDVWRIRLAKQDVGRAGDGLVVLPVPPSLASPAEEHLFPQVCFNARDATPTRNMVYGTSQLVLKVVDMDITSGTAGIVQYAVMTM